MSIKEIWIKVARIRLHSQLYHCENLAEFLLQDKNDKCYKKVNKKQIASKWHNSKRKRLRRTAEFQLQLQITGTGKEEHLHCCRSWAMAIHRFEASATYGVSVVKSTDELQVHRRLDHRDTGVFSGQYAPVSEVGCLLPTTALQNTFGKQFLWPMMLS